MNQIAGRPDVVEKLTFFLECGLRRGEIAVLEQAVGADEIAQLDLYIGIGPADVVDAKPPARVGMPQRKYAR
jgi:hypothetical protein